jgi:putative nucleotidyltransferase with HDIG domain
VLMNSLKIKILGIITIIVVAIILVAAIVNFQLQKQMINSVMEHNSLMLAETLKNSISSAMVAGRTDEVRAILSTAKNQDSFKSIRVIDASGTILHSADSGEVGRIISVDEQTALQSRLLNRPTSHPDPDSFATFSVIHNNPACHGCHEPAQEILGILEIDVTLDYLNQFLSNLKNNSIVATIILILLITVTISIFLIHYVDKPINHLINSMQQVENGYFEPTPVIASSTEMMLLSTKHNRMVDRLKAQMDMAINHERELARAQEKLAHHREIHAMNEKFEEQIKEIENLNISLEERIEETEEANYKISDLAGELEDKNTNLKKAVAKLSTLYKVGLAINSTMEIELLFSLIVKNTMDTLQAEIGYIILHEPGEDFLRVTTLIGHECVSPSGTMLPMKPSSVSTWVIQNRKPLLIADINEAPQFDRFSAIGYERKTLICAPLQIKDEIIGTITAVNKLDSSIYTSEELDLLNTIAAQASIAIKNATLYAEQQKIYMNTIHALVSAVEASDSYTRGHSERVTRYCLELGRKLDLSPERMKVIERAAILHDIGKIGIDLSLLHKEGKLSPDDVNALQQHPLIGMKILEPIEFLNDVKLCIGQHHERYDGLGYPNNVPSDKLLMESRILAIADAFDAMTSDRPYRKALPLEVAIRELCDNAGTQFDPHITPYFVELLRNRTFDFLGGEAISLVSVPAFSA